MDNLGLVVGGDGGTCAAGSAGGVYLVRITDVEGKKHVARVAVKE